ncbi:MAG TPA: glycosyltransferase [Solirubrobacterales bacterium]|jgi:phosphatidylinositol alpha-mannosyltransferase
MRIALVTPYSWTFPGGVNRHVEELAEELLRRGHDVRVLAPWDPPDRIARLTHRGWPEPRERPDYLRTLGRTVGIGANGAVSNLSTFPEGVSALRRELDAFEPDVVHVHEPPAGVVAWDACSYRRAPVVGTFHAYSTKPIPNYIANLCGARRKFNQLAARIAVSEAAAWTGRRWFGGSYTIVPNGVDLDAAPSGPKPPADHLRVLFVGRPEPRKGLPVLLQAFDALIEHVPSRLQIIGVERADVERYVADPDTLRYLDVLGRVEEDELWRRLHEADVLCAPSLSGESFGMILTEAFAAGTPVIASNIAGYSEVVTDGVDGILVPPADPQRLAEELQLMYHEPARRQAMARAARGSALRYGWGRVADQVERVYERAQYVSEPESRLEAFARRTGIVPIDGSRPRPPVRLPSLDPEPVKAATRTRTVRRTALTIAGVLAIGLTALAANRVGLDSVARSIVRSDATWLLVATGLMIASLFLRAISWTAIARAALPRTPLRRRDVASATMIGVLMSATLPARLGEPARAMVLARRTGRMRENLPVLLGTLVSQTSLNIIALILLGVIIVSTTDLFHARTERLFLFSLAPLALLIAVVLAPTLVRRNGSGRVARVVGAVREALVKVRRGLVVYKDPRRGPLAAGAQFAAWGLQLLACFVLFTALGLDRYVEVGIGAAAAVLFAVNVTAVVPATPSNIGVFQLAVISVLTTGFGVSAADALAYGVVLQAVEIATALMLGLPALVREGMTWQDLRLQALSTAPVRLSPRPDDGATDLG